MTIDTPINMWGDLRWAWYAALYANRGQDMTPTAVLHLTMRNLLSEGEAPMWALNEDKMSFAKIPNYLAQRIFVRSDEHLKEIGYTGDVKDLPDIKLTSEIKSIRNLIIAKILSSQSTPVSSTLSSEDKEVFKIFNGELPPGDAASVDGSSDSTDAWVSFCTFARRCFLSEKDRQLSEVVRARCTREGTIRFQLVVYSDESRAALKEFSIMFAQLRADAANEESRRQKMLGQTHNPAVPQFNVLSVTVQGCNDLKPAGNVQRVCTYADVHVDVLDERVYRYIRELMQGKWESSRLDVTWKFCTEGSPVFGEMGARVDRREVRHAIVAILKGRLVTERDAFADYVKETVCSTASAFTGESYTKEGIMEDDVNKRPNPFLVRVDAHRKAGAEKQAEFEKRLNAARDAGNNRLLLEIREEQQRFLEKWNTELYQLNKQFQVSTVDYESGEISIPVSAGAPQYLRPNATTESKTAVKSTPVQYTGLGAEFGGLLNRPFEDAMVPTAGRGSAAIAAAAATNPFLRKLVR